MKATRTHLLILLAAAAMLLSACGDAMGPASWAGITLVDDTIYMAYQTHVYGISAANGSMLWQYPEKADAQINFYAPPTLDDQNRLILGGYNKILYLLDPQNLAQPVWSFEEAKNTYVAQPLFYEGRIYAPNSDGTLYVLDANKNILWTHKSEFALWGKPVTDGERLYLSAQDHSVYALDLQSGQLLWKSTDLGGAVIDAPALGGDGRLYVGTLGRKMLVLDAASGEVRGEFATQGWVWGTPLLDGGRLYFGDVAGYFYALDAASLSEAWRFSPEKTPGSAISSTPLLVDGVLYFGAENGTLYALQSADGSVVCKTTLGGKIMASPVAAGERILVSSVGGEKLLVALSPDCSERWSFNPPK